VTVDWESAACRECDPEVWFPASRAQAAAKPAKQVCRGCELVDACKERALATGEEYGIWGGLTEDERRRLRRQPEGAKQL
jgi:WhiB family transcriptional regulator, redox-sensing transcriptional regulator